MIPTTSRSERIRVTLPAQERAYLHWLALESGNEETREAALLLIQGIRLAMRRYRRLYGGLPIDPADQKTLEQNTVGEPGARQPEQFQTWPDHHPIGRYDPDPGDPPLVLPEWAQEPAQTPHRERGFAGHGQKEEPTP